MFPLALAPFIPAAAAGIGAFAKGAQRYGPQITQLANRGLTGLRNYLNPVANMVNVGQTQGQPIQNLAKMSVTSMPILDPAMNLASSLTKGSDSMGTAQAAEIDESMPPSNWMDELIEEEIEKETKNKKTKKEDKKEKKSKENKDKKDKDLELKKGGYVKKQRKRKPYKSTGFVKIKKTKKRKYIKE
jgi:hypothetical protein